MADEEWGPWIEHDGKGCPCLGAWAQTERLAPTFWPESRFIIKVDGKWALIEGPIRQPEPWDWSMFGKLLPNKTIASKVLRYRIKKPKGLVILEKLLQELPVKQPKVYHDIEV
jgi:hypothetical protein